MRAAIFLLLIVLLVPQCPAADNYVTPVRSDIIPPAPTAATVVEQQMPRPSLLTGAVDFALPLYTVEVDGFSLPISLQYHTNGIKVYDDPGLLGYGWSLLPALRVTRTIMGRPDELSEDVTKNLASFTSQDRWKLAFRCMSALVSNRADSQPDIFSIALPGIVLTRVLDRSNGNFEFVGVGDDEYRVETSDALESIRVTDPQGRIFIFGGTSMLKELCNMHGYEHGCVYSWLLSKIELPTRRDIVFEWTNVYPSSREVNGGASLVDLYDRVTGEEEVGQNGLDYTYWRNVGTPLQAFSISKIRFPNGTVDFYYQHSPSVLERMTVSNSTHRVIKDVKLNSKLLSNNIGRWLTSVDISGDGKYSFSYNDVQFRHTNGVDWWGYYNGKDNSVPIPKIKIKRYSAPNTFNMTYATIAPNSDRNVSEKDMKANILTRITYPGGAVDEFDYEPHTFPAMGFDSGGELHAETNHKLSSGGGLRVVSVVMKDKPGGVDINRVSYSYEDPVVRAVPAEASFISIRSGLMKTSEINGRWACRARLVDISPISDYMRYDIGEIPIWYKTVTEHSSGGKTIYRHSDSKAPKNGISTTFGRRIIGELNRVASKGPRLESYEIYRDNGFLNFELVESHKYEYELIKSTRPLLGVFIYRDCVQFGKYADMFCPDFKDGDKIDDQSIRQDNDIRDFPYSLYRYRINLYTERLVRETVKNEERNVTMTTRYKSDRCGLPIEKTESHTAGTRTTVISYPDSSGTEIEREMIKSNFVGVPLKTQTSLGDCKNYVRADYIKVRDRLFRPRRIVSWKSGATDSIVSPTYMYNSNYYGSLVQETDADGCVTSYMYGYNGMYPCYKVEGLGWHDVNAPAVFFTGSAECAELPLQQDALVSAIEYSPLLGVTAMTTPWGCRSVYGYNSDGRLASIALDGIGTSESFTYSINADGGFVNTAERWLSSNGLSRHKKETRYDGLGRLIANIDLSASGTDGASYTTGVSEHYKYDIGGRLCKIAENVAGTDAPVDVNVWKQLLYESSPRNIRTGEIKAGEQWRAANKRTSIKISSGRSVPFFILRLYSDSEGNIKTSSTLSISMPTKRITDEDGIRITKATDTDGNLIFYGLGDDVSACTGTYYVYDDFGRLCYILPPSIVPDSYDADDPVLAEHAYIYRYDDRDRMVYSKTPGAAPARFVYSPAGRLVAETDATLAEGVWRLHLYDKFGREVVTGTATLADSDIASLSEKAWPVGPPTGDYITETPTDPPLLYDLSGVPKGSDFAPEKISVYDVYPDYAEPFRSGSGSAGSRLDTPAGLLTYMVNRHTDETFHTDTYYYDRLGRPIQTLSRYMQTDIVHSVSYNYAGAKSYERTEVANPLTNKRHTLLMRYYYDRAERLSKVSAYLSEGDTVSIETCYSPSGHPFRQDYYKGERFILDFNNPKAGRLFCKEYEYDVHGWQTKAVTKIPRWAAVFPHASLGSEVSRPFYSRALAGDSLFMPWIKEPELALTNNFVEEILYADGANARYNGTPSAHIAAGAGRYDYRYDSFDRLVAADYTPKVPDSDEDFSTAYQYDDMGRPLAVTRYGVVDSDGESETFGLLDKFTLDYDGPLLSSVTSRSDEVEGTNFYGRTGLQSGLSEVPATYTFNADGRLKRDGASGHSYHYTPTGLVSEIHNSHLLMQPRLQQSEYITYDADGRRTERWQTRRNGGRFATLSYRRYVGPFTFNTDTLERVDFPGGYFDGHGKAHFLLTDWQGNVDMVVGSDGKMVQHNTYYPYGEPHREPSGQRRLFAGKERQDYVASGTSDFGPRRYFSSLPLWGAGDKNAADYAPISPYVFCGANPIKNIDPSGNDIVVLLADSDMHLAALIEHEDEKFYYYSINGINKYLPIFGFVGGRPFNDIAVGPFSSPEAFMQSDYNSHGEKTDESSNYYGFSNAYRIPTSTAQDKIMAKTFKDIAENESYQLLWNNCATTVSRAMMAAGLNSGLLPSKDNPLQCVNYFANMQHPMLFLFNNYMNYIFPLSVYNSIMQANPNGHEIEK